MNDELQRLKEENERLGKELNQAKYGDPNFSWELHQRAMTNLLDEVESLQKEKDKIESFAENLSKRLADCISYMDTREKKIPGIERQCDAAKEVLKSYRASFVQYNEYDRESILNRSKERLAANGERFRRVRARFKKN